MRRGLSGIRNPLFRKCFPAFAALFLYVPLILLGRLLSPFGLGRLVPIYDYYRGKSLARIRQDAYDRFFTPIEQRVSRSQVEELKDTFTDITVSNNPPYWHFLCRR